MNHQLKRMLTVLVLIALTGGIFVATKHVPQLVYASTVFTDDFENNDNFALWNSTREVYGELSINTTNPYSGAYHAQFDTDSIGWTSEGGCSKYIDGTETMVYAYAYFWWNETINMDGRMYEFIQFSAPEDSNILEVQLFRTNSTSYIWRLNVNGTSYDSDAVSEPTLETYVSIEAMINLSASGSAELWINNASMANVNSVDLSGISKISAVRLGAFKDDAPNERRFIWDLVTISNERIGGTISDPFNYSGYYNVTAASGSALDIQAAIDDVVANGTYPETGCGNVFIPAGTWNFTENSTPITVNVTLGVNIFGGGGVGFGFSGTGDETSANVTNLNIPTTWTTILQTPVELSSNNTAFFNLGCGGPGFSIWEWDDTTRNNKSIRFSGIELKSYRNIDNGSHLMQKGIKIYGVLDYRIDHVCILDCAGGGIETPLYYRCNLYCSGVIDHCRIYNTVGKNDLSNMYNGDVGYGVNLQRSYYLNSSGGAMPFDATTDIMGQYTNYTTYIENCYFSRWRHCTASGHGAHYVFRYNQIDNDFKGTFSLDIHGLRDSEDGRAGSRGGEFYENTLANATYAGSDNSTTEIRGILQTGGGYFIFFNNNIDTSYQYVCLYSEDYVASETWHLKDVYLWSALGDLTPSVTFPVGDINFTERNGDINWTRTAGNYGTAGYPNTNAQWSINGYTPYIYPHPLVSNEVTYVYLNVTSAAGGSTDVGVGIHEYIESSNAVVEALPSEGYSFVNWTLNGEYAGTSNPIIVNMNTNHTLTPVFVVDFGVDEITLDEPSYAYEESTNPTVTFKYTIDFNTTTPVNATFWSNVTGTWVETLYLGYVLNDAQNSFNYTFPICGTFIWNVGVTTNVSSTIFADTNHTLTVNIKQTSNYNVTRYVIEGSFDIATEGDIIETINNITTHWKIITLDQLTFSDMPLVKVYIKPNDNVTSTPSNMWRDTCEWVGNQTVPCAVYEEQSILICFKEVYSETPKYLMNGEYKIVVMK